jgi:hypothetical protein
MSSEPKNKAKQTQFKLEAQRRSPRVSFLAIFKPGTNQTQPVVSLPAVSKVEPSNLFQRQKNAALLDHATAPAHITRQSRIRLAVQQPRLDRRFFARIMGFSGIPDERKQDSAA